MFFGRDSLLCERNPCDSMWFHVIPCVYVLVFCLDSPFTLHESCTRLRVVGCITRMPIVSYCICLRKCILGSVPYRYPFSMLCTTALPYNITQKTISIHRRTQHDVIIRFINVKKVKPNARAPTICCFLSSFPCGKRPPTLFFAFCFNIKRQQTLLLCCVVKFVWPTVSWLCVYIYNRVYIYIHFFSFRIDILMRDRHTVYVSMHFIHTIDRQPRPFMYFFCGSTMSWMDIFGGWALLFSIVGGKGGGEGLGWRGRLGLREMGSRGAYGLETQYSQIAIINLIESARGGIAVVRVINLFAGFCRLSVPYN